MKCYLFESEGKKYVTYGENQMDVDQQFFEEFGTFPDTTTEVDVSTVTEGIESGAILYF